VTQYRRSWWPDLLLAAGVALITWVLAAGGLLGFDVAVRNWVDTHRPVPVKLLAETGNYLGQGGYLTMICAVIALLLAWRRHTVRPVLPVAVAFALTVVALQPLKTLTDRPAPHAALPHPERFGAGGVSYPSGHLVNALVWYGVLVLLLAPWLSVPVRRVVRVVPPAVLTVTTVYLGFHWFTDTVAGLLLAFLLDRLMHRVPWDTVPLGRRLHAVGWDGPGLPGYEPVSTHEPARMTRAT
jgi:membrane-associated phospholipid phosphatase